MKKLGVRIMALVLAAAMVLSVGAFAADGTGTQENADRLHALGLFQGTGSGYALDKTATRLQGLIMLIRLLGEEDEALRCHDPCPFRDVAAGNPSRYTAYAYRIGYTTGTSATTFSPGGTMNFKGYVTFLLRALGYDDRAGDFTYAACLNKAAELGMMDAASAATIGRTSPTFYRADLVDLSLAALTVKMKGRSTTLEAGFQEGRFTTSVTPRTAIGKLANGKLVIVSTSAASIQQMRELMLQLGCVEAVNLDGGASTALAYQGKLVRTPGRQLTTTLQVVVR